MKEDSILKSQMDSRLNSLNNEQSLLTAQNNNNPASEIFEPLTPLNEDVPEELDTLDYENEPDNSKSKQLITIFTSKITRLQTILNNTISNQKLKRRDKKSIKNRLKARRYPTLESGFTLAKLVKTNMMYLNLNPLAIDINAKNSDDDPEDVKDITKIRFPSTNELRFGLKSQKHSNKITVVPSFAYYDSEEYPPRAKVYAADQYFMKRLRQKSGSNPIMLPANNTATSPESDSFESESETEVSGTTNSVASETNFDLESEGPSWITLPETNDSNVEKAISTMKKSIEHIEVAQDKDEFERKKLIQKQNLYLIDCNSGCETRDYKMRTALDYRSRDMTDMTLKTIKNLNNASYVHRVNIYIAILLASGFILVISGIFLFLFFVGIGFNFALTDYFRQSVSRFTPYFVTLLGGILQPLIVGLYCIFALYYLRHIRPYFLRIPFTLVLPLALLITGVRFCHLVNNQFEEHLQRQMSLYPQKESTDIRYIWDEIQLSLSCCGIHNETDWSTHFIGSGLANHPKSCCINQEDSECPNFSPLSAFHSEGCYLKLYQLNLGVGILLSVHAVLQLTVEVLSLICFKLLHLLIKDQMDDYRSTCRIIMGRFYPTG